MRNKKITRRKLLKDTAFATIAGALYFNSPLKAFGRSNSKTKVILIRDKNVLDSERNVNDQVIQ